MTCREDNVLSAIAKERDPDLWMRREHHCRQNQIKTVIVSLTAGGKSRQRAPEVPSCQQRHKATARERQVRCRYLLEHRKQEQIQQSTRRADLEFAEFASTRRLLRERKDEEQKLAQSRVKAKQQARRMIVAVEQHRRRADMLYRGWLPWVKRVKEARVEEVKALRHRQYCVAQDAWEHWQAYLGCIRTTRQKFQARKVAMVSARLELRQQMYFWKRWVYHQRCLSAISSKVRGEVRLAILSSRWQWWIKVWAIQARRNHELGHRANMMGQQVVRSRAFRGWKLLVEELRTKNQLAEERNEIWRKIDVWLKPQVFP